MSIPRYIFTPSEFSAALAPGDIENKFRDFKQTIHNWQIPSSLPDRAKKIREAQKEVCRDIAQFANTEGGCLIIGIAESRDVSTGLKVFDRIVGVSDPEAMKDWISNAVQNLLTPKTLSHTIDPIQTSGGIILAVNIHPSRHMVALWDRQENTIEFLYRTSHGKAWMNPSEAEVHMMSGSRFGRIAIEKAIAKFVAERTVRRVQGPLIVDLASGVFQRNVHGDARWAGLTITIQQPNSEDDDTFALTIDGAVQGTKTVWVPFGAVRDCWFGKNQNGEMAIGLLLSVRIIALSSQHIVIEG